MFFHFFKNCPVHSRNKCSSSDSWAESIEKQSFQITTVKYMLSKVLKSYLRIGFRNMTISQFKICFNLRLENPGFISICK